MEDSILLTIKKLLGISDECEHFDTDIIIHINTVLGILNQLGIGKEKFFITDNTSKWSDFFNGDEKLEMVKTYIYLKVRLIFDPPTLGSVKEAINNTVSELECRITYND